MNVGELSHQLVIDEGLQLKPYRDTVGKYTIGVGRNLDDVGVSKTEAMGLLANDIAGVVAELDYHLPWWSQMSDIRQQAVANMVFNMGITKFLQFKNMLAALRVGHYDEAAAEMLDSLWAKQVGSRAQRLATMMRNG